MSNARALRPVGRDAHCCASRRAVAGERWMPAKKTAAQENGDALYIDTSDDEAAMQVIRATVLSLWDAVDNLSRIRPRRADAYYVTIFGSARIRPNTTFYREVRRLARELAEMG